MRQKTLLFLLYWERAQPTTDNMIVSQNENFINELVACKYVIVLVMLERYHR